MVRTGRSQSLGSLRLNALAKVRSQSGFMLIMVLFSVFFLSVVGLAVMRMTVTATKTSVGLTLGSETLTDIDSALEEASNLIRNEPSECSPSGIMVAVSTGDPILVTCDSVPSTSGPATRTANLFAERNGEYVGKARIRVLDEVNGQPVQGYSIEVCDWLLGTASSGVTPLGCKT